MRCAVCGELDAHIIHVKPYGAAGHDFDAAIPASRVRALAVKWTSTIRGVNLYMEGRLDQANVCAEELKALLREYEGGAS